MAFISTKTEHFTTPRLLARRIVAEDREGLAATLAGPDIEYAFGRTLSEDFAEQHAPRWADGHLVFTLIETAGQETVGFAMVKAAVVAVHDILSAELEIAVAPQHHRRGYGLEAMCGLIPWAFDAVSYPHGETLDALYAFCKAGNIASIGLMTQLAEIGVEDLGEQDGVDLSTSLADLQSTLAGQPPTPPRIRPFQVTRTGFRRHAPCGNPQATDA